MIAIFEAKLEVQSRRERPVGLTVIALAFFAAAVYVAACGGLVMAAILPLASGATLLGGLETMGSTVFLIAASVAGLTGYGLLKLNDWARRLATAIAAAELFSAIPAVSSAVVDSRVLAIIGEGVKIIVAVVIIRYLYLEAVDLAFAQRASIAESSRDATRL